MNTKKPYLECPRFSKCNVNNCPLHPEYPNLYVDAEDMKTKCTMEKQVRLRVGSKYPEVLKLQGLTPSEYSAKQRFENMTDEERQELRERAKNAQKFRFSETKLIGGRIV